MAKHVLHSDSRELDFELIGISSPENLYAIVNSINTALNIDLALSNNIPYTLKGGKLFHFSLFSCDNEDLGLQFFLISNNSNLDDKPAESDSALDGLFADVKVDESTRLIKELPKTDYFLILKGEELYEFTHKITELLKKIPEIVQVQSIQPDELPSRMNLVF